MITATGRAQCFTCGEEKIPYKCVGCSQDFCFNHLTEHRQTFGTELGKIENDRNLFQKTLIQQKQDLEKNSLIDQINKWEKDSINKIKQTVEECRQILLQHTDKYINQIENKLIKLADEIKTIRKENEFNEINLNQLKTTLTNLKEEFANLRNISIQQDSVSFISKISVISSSDKNVEQTHENNTNDADQQMNDDLIEENTVLSKRALRTNKNRQDAHEGQKRQADEFLQNTAKKQELNDLSVGDNVLAPVPDVDRGPIQEREILFCPQISLHTKWKQNGVTIAGSNGKGIRLNQLNQPEAIYIDDDQTIYIADRYNHRIVEWRCGENSGRVVAGGNGEGDGTNQLNQPTDVCIDKANDSLIISDWKNRRIVRWSRRNGIHGQIIISNIDCWGLTMDNNGYLYVVDAEKQEVRGWKIRDSCGTIVAGGNGKGRHLNQLSCPSFIFVDGNYSVYISDCDNSRVMKWIKDAKEGIVVAGGNGKGSSLTQLSSPRGVIVDHLDQIYVADRDNHQVMRWCEGATHGTIVVGGSGKGGELNQLNQPVGLSFDRQGNFYVVDRGNHRIQKFEIDLN